MVFTPSAIILKLPLSFPKLNAQKHTVPKAYSSCCNSGHKINGFECNVVAINKVQTGMLFL